MFKAICGLIFAVVVRILIEYLSRQFTFLVSWVPWFTWICIGVAAFVGILMVVKIIGAIARLVRERNESKAGGTGK